MSHAEDDADERQIVRWTVRRIVNKLTELFAFARLEVNCEVCDELYRHHARDPHKRSTTLLCDGGRVHL